MPSDPPVPDIWVLIMTTGGVDRDVAIFDSEVKARAELPDADMTAGMTFRVERATAAFEFVLVGWNDDDEHVIGRWPTRAEAEQAAHEHLPADPGLRIQVRRRPA